MGSTFENDQLTLVDADGNELLFELLATIEHDGHDYAVLLPSEEDDSADDEVTILEIVTDNGEETLAGIEDQAVLDSVYEEFRKLYDPIG